MFKTIIFILLAMLLFLATSAALYMGVFKAHRNTLGWTSKLSAGLVSFTVSGLFWYLAYGFHYLGW